MTKTFLARVLLAAAVIAAGGSKTVAGEALAFKAGATQAAVSRTPGDGVPFNDCGTAAPCPDLVVVPGAAATRLGSPQDEAGRLASEAEHAVRMQAFAIGTTEVSVAQYRACVADGGCREPEWLEPGGPDNIHTGTRVTYKSLGEFVSGDGQPVVGVSFEDAAAYAVWLSKKTGYRYRLPSEAEWEHAARAGTRTAYWWGNEPTLRGEAMACCRGCGSERDAKGLYPVQSLKANPWGLFHVHGNVWEWVADYYCEAYETGPADGTARSEPACPKQAASGDQASAPSSPEGLRVFRGGSCFYEPRQMRASMRLRNWPSFRNQTIGFRIARDLDPAPSKS